MTAPKVSAPNVAAIFMWLTPSSSDHNDQTNPRTRARPIPVDGDTGSDQRVADVTPVREGHLSHPGIAKPVCAGRLDEHRLVQTWGRGNESNVRHDHAEPCPRAAPHDPTCHV